MKIEKCTPQMARKLARLISHSLQCTYDGPLPKALALARTRIKEENFEFFFEKSVETNHSEIYIAKDYGHIVGCFNLSLISEYENGLLTGEIEGNYVLEPFRHLRYGHECLDFIERRFMALKYDKIYIWLLTKSTRAINFYRRHGYNFDGQTRPVLFNTFFTEQRFSKKISVSKIVRHYSAQIANDSRSNRPTS